jgi:PAS domain S-box-containing protein
MFDVQSLQKTIQKFYLIVFILIAIIFSFSFLYLNQLVKQTSVNSALINMAGKQRMLSQKIQIQLFTYQNTLAKSEQASNIKKDLMTTVQLMQNNHQKLLMANDEVSIKTRALYFQLPTPLHQQVNAFIETVLLVLSNEKTAQAKTILATNFSDQNLSLLLLQLDNVVQGMEEASIKQLTNIKVRIVLLWLIITLFIILLSVYFLKKSRELLKQKKAQLISEKQQSLMIQYAVDQHSIIYQIDNNVITYVNEQFCLHYQYQDSEILGKTHAILHTEYHSIEFTNSIMDMNKNGKTWQGELYCKAKNGHIYCFETSIAPITDDDNNIISTVVIQHDISKQKSTLRSLRELHQITSSQHDGLTEKIQKVLALGCSIFNLPFAIISDIKGFDYKVVHALSPNNEIELGSIFKLTDTYCIHTYNADKPTAFHHASKSHIKNHPCYQAFKLESYIGTPIFINGQRSGTLNFSSPHASLKPFDDNDLELIRLFSQWIGHELYRDEQQCRLDKQQLLMTQISEQARIGAWEVDLVNNAINWSAMTKVIHEVPDDFIPDLATAIEFYKEGKSRDTIQRLVQQSMFDGSSFKVELELNTAKNNQVWVAASANAEMQNGKCVRLYGSFQDITERVKSEEDIQNKSQRITLATDAAGIGIWEFNIADNKLKWDEWMFRLYGINPKDFNGTYDVWQNSIHPEDRERTSKEAEIAIINNSKFDTQFRVIHPNKDIRHIKASAIVLQDENKQACKMIGVNYDVTERVLTEEALIKAKLAAEAAAQTKNVFLASMSHEIRTPINGVIGMLNLLEESQLNSTQKHQISIAQSSANSLLHLINDILDFSKIEANKLELENIKFNLLHVLNDVTQPLALEAQKKGLTFNLNNQALNEAVVVGDPNRIRQILNNLVSNAIKFTHQGEINITTAMQLKNHKTWLLSISIKDTGIGIDALKQTHLFKSFSQVDASTTRKFGGTGLGLAIVKKLSNYMNGYVEVESKLGKGSTFTCYLELGKTQQSLPLISKKAFNKLKVLVVNQNSRDAKALTQQFAQWQVTTKHIESSNEALDYCHKIAKEQPENLFDIIIVNTDTSQVNAIELTLSLQKHKLLSASKLILFSENDLHHDIDYFSSIGISAYFQNPVNPSDLFDTFNIIVEGGETIQIIKPLITKNAISLINNNHKNNNLSPEIIWPSNTFILLVEDNRINQAVAKGVLNKLSLNCDIAVNGIDALKKLTDNPDKYALIIMDCQMPEMDGYEATQQIRQGIVGNHYSTIPIIAMTANAMLGDKEKCLSAGMNDYLSKPVNKDSLHQKLEHWLT